MFLYTKYIAFFVLISEDLTSRRTFCVEENPGYRFINADLPNGSSQLNEKDSRPCLKEAFKDILLVIVYNYPLYDSIPHLIALYKPAFPNLLFCGPPHNTAPSDILTVEVNQGYLGYECLGRAIRQHPGYKGHLYSNDDVILKFWNFPDFDREKIWESREFLNHLFSKRVHQYPVLGWKWWNSTYGLKNCRRACEDVANMTLQKENLNGVHLLNTLLKNSKGTLRCFRGRADVLYIPQKHAKAFSILSNMFYRQKVFLEIAVPTINRLVELNENIGRLPGRYIHYQEERRGTDSRFFWHLYFTNDDYFFTHPFKLHGRQELDNKLNLVMFRYFLMKQVKELTNCARNA